MQLTRDQEQVIKLCALGHNVFFTGMGGSGKSTTIHFLKEHFKNEGKNIHTLASTGIASVQLGGSTLHSFAGVGRINDSTENIIARALKN